MRQGLGLRGQLLLALTIAFVAAFALLGTAVVQLDLRARLIEDRQRLRTAAEAACLLMSPSVPRQALVETLGDWMAASPASRVVGVELRFRGTEPLAYGRLIGASLDHDCQRGLGDGYASLTLYQVPSGEGGSPLSRLLLLYVAVTAAAIMGFVYVALTHWIVRPVTRLTQASERLLHRGADARVKVGGAGEVARLGVTFNRMAQQLSQERDALERRLDELSRTTRALEEARDQVVRSERLASVGRLSAGVAHEIGNPLAAVLGFVELLRQGGLEPDEQREFLRRIQVETERIHGIIRQLLDFSRRAPDADHSRATCDVEQVVEDAVRLVGPQKDLHQVTLERRLEEGLPKVVAPQDELSQVLLNLLLNAADAMRGEGHVLITAERSGTDRVRLVVEDNGPGIDADVLEHIFEPFVTTKPPGKGTGLGLAVCHTIVERVGASITAGTGAQGGARFELLLRVAD